VIYKPIPKDVRKAKTIKMGKASRLIGGTNRYTKNITININREIAKSTKLVITELAGMIIRGK
jgi:hypothetical protein